MATMGLLLRPLDVLLFRDARPFGVGDSGRSQFPLPQTFAGLIKTYLTHKFDWRSRDWHGNHSRPEGLRSLPEVERPWHARLKMRGPWVFAEDVTANGERVPKGPLVPTPADVIRLGKGKETPLDRLRPLSDVDTKQLPDWNPPVADMRPMWLNGRDSPVAASGLLDVDQLRTYLAGDVPGKTHSLDTFALIEQRTGIGIDADRLTADQEQGLIYSATFWRLCHGVCFYAEVELPDSVCLPGPRGEPVPNLVELFSDGLHLPWGGEGRRVAIERVAQPFDWQSLQPTGIEHQRLTVLVTPGIFSNAAHPWHPTQCGTLRGAVIPKPQPVSGWDVAGVAERGQTPSPRPTRFAVPAGAVYLWERGARTSDDGVPPPLESLCDRPQDKDYGWGLILNGRWSECTFTT